ncbi:hypothetical protein J6590_009609 [Homalodisca vitripennis]|nr:hypothetical protein J6590_009609 [Homalodisca vitripennis]
MAIIMNVLKQLLNEMIKEIIDGQVNKERKFGKSLEHCSKTIDENKTLIKTVGLMEENKLLKAQLKDMSLRQGDLEQYSRRNTMEIFGVPESADENNLSLKKIKFLRHDDPDQLLAWMRRKRDFSTCYLQGYNTNQQIYINPSVTPVRRVLLAKACRLRVDFNYKFVWFDGVGKIKVKCDDKSNRVMFFF